MLSCVLVAVVCLSDTGHAHTHCRGHSCRETTDKVNTLFFLFSLARTQVITNYTVSIMNTKKAVTQKEWVLQLLYYDFYFYYSTCTYYFIAYSFSLCPPLFLSPLCSETSIINELTVLPLQLPTAAAFSLF